MEARMKHIVIFFSLVLFMVGIICPTVVINPDKSLKGEWDFQCKKLLEIEGYEEQVLALVQKFCVNEKGDIYLFDRRHFKFFVFDKNGKPKFSFGSKGEGPGEIKIMLGFFLIADYVIVSDMGKVHYFGQDGKFKKSVPTTSSIGVAPLLFIDENRMVKTRLVAGFSAVPETMEIFNLSTKTSIYLEGNPLTADQKKTNRGVLVLYHTNSNEFEMKTNFIAGKFTDKILWGKNDTYLIRACDFSGKEHFAFSIAGRKPKKINKEYKERFISRKKLRGGGKLPDVIKKELMKGISDYSTYFFKIEPGHNNLIYVYVSDVVRENGQEIDIFSSAGKYLYHADIVLPGSHRILANGVVFKDVFLYVVLEEQDSGELSLHKYSIKPPPNLSEN
jgi:hypothetical protein